MTTVYVGRVLLLLTIFLSVWKVDGEDLPLDMATESVDDSFENCLDQIRNLVLEKYLPSELKSSNDFSKAWNNAQNKTKPNTELSKNQLAAIYVYTVGGNKPLFENFNNASRNGTKDYKAGSFKFYTLYFFLTDAIQKLKRSNSNCLTSYRRTKLEFVTDVLNKKIRLGSFTSSSLFSNITKFGNKSCFIIRTCFGAEIYNYSYMKSEKEVLIPPYEVFNVTSIKKISEQKDPWCDVEYTLNSTGKKSYVNCMKGCILKSSL
ncbi:NAD(P)(+)--arginine ADP-ribosyltransferase 2-like [Brachyhypopomus gauderio]|uniref:NAD(P)(+)--arginine ADP-ribosyltransferase 2-like n=1 Tax=Brachyhypopomus gauderio TaxID=698409 RepID=UPI0040425577